MQKLIENLKPIFGTAPADYTGAASSTDIVNLSKAGGALVVIQTGAWAAGTAAVTLRQATDVAASDEKALAFTLQYTNVAGSDDTLTETAVTSNTFNLTTASKLHVIDVKTSQLDKDNDFNCISCDIASPGANSDLYSVLIIPYDLRYATHPDDQPSMIV